VLFLIALLKSTYSFFNCWPFGCSKSDKVDHKSIYFELTKNEIPENQIANYLDDRDSLEELAILSWNFEKLAEVAEMLSKNTNSIFLVSK
jgi:hypothetical protein